MCNADGGMRLQSVDMPVRQVLGNAAHVQENRRHGQGRHVLSHNRLKHAWQTTNTDGTKDAQPDGTLQKVSGIFPTQKPRFAPSIEEILVNGNSETLFFAVCQNAFRVRVPGF